VLFNSYTFVFGFLPVTLAVFFLLGRIGRRGPALAWLFGASLFFYAWWNPANLPLLVLSIGFNYALGQALRRAWGHRLRTSLLTAGVAANLVFLGYHKYAGFLAASINAAAGTQLPEIHRPLPLAISFFTFQQIVFLVDGYRRPRAATGPLRYATCVSFFPHLLAGPIVQYSQLMPQFSRRAILRPQAMMIAAGITIFAIGLVKKVIVGDTLGGFVPIPFGAAASGLDLTLVEAWAAALSYTFQIYFDFSGYSDMAIGLALMLGISLPVNFNSPYKADSIIDFWRRWHMTLSAFLRDYLYIPLGGGRVGRMRRYVNLMITMLLGGLWHGAAWTFVAWGALHGVYLLINHAWRGAGLRANVPGSRYAARLVTFAAVVVAWVLFRADSVGAAGRIIAAMFGANGISLPHAWTDRIAALAGGGVPSLAVARGMGTLGGWSELRWLALSFIVVWLCPNTQQIMAAWARGHFPSHSIALAQPAHAVAWQPAPRWAFAIALLAFIGIMGLTRASAFIYFNF
jgi:alginate O-acetyltransferase complex protein AlgI